jgi:hypothetical protein
MQTIGPICLANLPSVPWKNGGGSTCTLVADPPSAGFDNFFWRISLAEIAVSGPFSSFAGIDRIILLWRGSGVILKSTSWPSRVLTQPCEPFAFVGEDPVTCTLIDGPTIDLNLMYRRDAISAILTVHTAATIVDQSAETCIILCNKGGLRVEGSTGELTLLTNHLIYFTEFSTPLSLTPLHSCSIYIIILILKSPLHSEMI